jgi:hypothetical protein
LKRLNKQLYGYNGQDNLVDEAFYNISDIEQDLTTWIQRNHSWLTGTSSYIKTVFFQESLFRDQKQLTQIRETDARFGFLASENLSSCFMHGPSILGFSFFMVDH